MTASVVTFSNQTAANGATIARAVAERLRFRYYDWEVMSQAAAAAGVSPEVIALATAQRAPTLFERMMRRLAAVGDETEDVPLTPPASRPSVLTSEDYRQFIEQVVRELGRQGDAVIVGHASQAVLREAPGVLKVLLHGSVQRRAERLVANQGISPEQARTTIEGADRQRSDFFRRNYHIDWLDASRYDVALNTDRISTDLARDMIVAMAREVP
jgi:hypothetical protein